MENLALEDQCTGMIIYNAPLEVLPDIVLYLHPAYIRTLALTFGLCQPLINSSPYCALVFQTWPWQRKQPGIAVFVASMINKSGSSARQ